MGNQFYSNVATIVGAELMSSAPPLDFYPNSVEGVSETCIDSFRGKGGKSYSSISLRIAALVTNADVDYQMMNRGVFSLKNLGCEKDSVDEDLLQCDWNMLYDRIVTECKIADLRGVVNMPGGYYLEGTCEELLGITPEIIADGVLDPTQEWCPVYYDGREGVATLATIEVQRDIDQADMDEPDPMVDLLEKTLGVTENSVKKLIIENVPYCTAFDSCTDEEFFTMVNLEAEAYTSSIQSESYDIMITPQEESKCVDSALRFKRGKNKSGCQWAGKGGGNRCKIGIKKHCPKACDACEQFACTDSARIFYTKDKQELKCADVASDSENMCKIEGVKTVCRETCGHCE